MIILIICSSIPLICGYWAFNGKIRKASILGLPFIALTGYLYWGSTNDVFKFEGGGGPGLRAAIALIFLVPLSVLTAIIIPSLAWWGKQTGRY